MTNTKQITLDLDSELYQVLENNAKLLEISVKDYILKQLIEILEEKKIKDLENLNPPRNSYIG